MTPLAATSPDPLRESLHNLSVGNRDINAVWTPSHPTPADPRYQQLQFAGFAWQVVSLVDISQVQLKQVRE